MSRLNIIILLAGLAVVATGCATKNWVRDVVGQERLQTDQRVGQVDQRLADETQRIATLDSRLGEEAKRVDALDVSVKTVGESARAAGEASRTAGETAEAARGLATASQERAESATQKADEVDGRLTRLWTNRHKRNVIDTVQVHFGFNRSELDDGAQTALLPIIEELKRNPGLEIVLQGYTDGRGSKAYNLELSRRRVEAVRRFLVEHGIELWRVNAIGLGPLVTAQIPDREKRRVSVMLTASE